MSLHHTPHRTPADLDAERAERLLAQSGALRPARAKVKAVEPGTIPVAALYAVALLLVWALTAIG